MRKERRLRADTRWRRRLGHGIVRVVSLLGLIVERSDPQIDLGHLEASTRRWVEANQRQVFELLRQELGAAAARGGADLAFIMQQTGHKNPASSDATGLKINNSSMIPSKI